MKSPTPAQLPEVDRVEIVDLSTIDPPRVSLYMKYASAAPRLSVSAHGAQTIARLWRGLVAGEQSRCHVPVFGLRFFSKGTLRCEASVCFQCDNIFGMVGESDLSYAFEARHRTAQELLAICKSAELRTATE